MKRLLTLLLAAFLLFSSSWIDVDAAQISRLRDAEIENGNILDADDLDAEFNQLVSESNDQDDRLDDIESNAFTFSGVKTFSSTPLTNDIDERTSGSGVTVDGVLLKDSTAKVSTSSDPSSPDDGTVWYNSADDDLKFRQNGSTVTVATESYVTSAASVPKGYISPASARPVYASASTFTVDSFYGKSSDNTTTIDITSQKTINIATSGLNGRATNYTEGTGEWIYLYAITDSLSASPTPGFLISTANVAGGGSISAGLPYDESGALTGTVATTIGAATVTGTSTTFLSDYVVGQTISITGGDDLVIQSVDSDTVITATSNATAAVSGAAHERWSPYNKYRQLPFAIRNDASGNFIAWEVMDGWPFRPYVQFKNIAFNGDGTNGTASPTEVLTKASSSSWSAVDCSGFVPPISTVANLKLFTGTTSTVADVSARVRPTGDTSDGYGVGVHNSDGDNNVVETKVPTNSSQSIDQKVEDTDIDFSIVVMGWVVTEEF